MYPTAAPFFVFLAGVCLLYWAASGSRPLRLTILLLASLFFIAKFGVGCLLLAPAAATLDFFFGRGIGRSKNAGVRRFFLLCSLALNVGLLLLMKGTGDRLNWLFTLSLSYYCFQQMSYTVDIFKGEIEPANGLLNYLSAATFFPVMTAGPINHLGDLIEKLRKPFLVDDQRGARALLLIASGLVKKLLIAQFLADNLVNTVLDDPKLYSGLEVLVAVWGYAFQLYNDFSGYTDIAMGAALLLGVKVPENFKRPYAAQNIAEFWRKWHITFSEWLRDYVYYGLLPAMLPAERSWSGAKFLFPILTMLLGGLWHGFAWTFVVWGGLHGSMLAMTRGWQDWRKRTGRKGTQAGRWAAVLLTFNFVCASWVFFRADSVADALGVFRRIGSCTFAADHLSLAIVLYLAAAVALHVAPERWFEWLVGLYARTPFPVQGAALAGVVLLLEAFAGKGAAPFAYSRF